jgi:hypothetical protein
LPDAAALAIAVHEARDVDLRERDAHEILPLPTDQLALGDVSAKVLPDLPPHDGSEARMILIDLQGHPLPA